MLSRRFLIVDPLPAGRPASYLSARGHEIPGIGPGDSSKHVLRGFPYLFDRGFHHNLQGPRLTDPKMAGVQTAV